MTIVAYFLAIVVCVAAGAVVAQFILWLFDR